MSRKLIAVFAPVVGLAMLAGCVPPPPPEVAVAPQPVAVAASPVVLVPPPAPVPVPVPRRHHAMRAAHPVTHHHRAVHHYRSVRTTYTTVWSPYCGSSAHPCTVEHTTAPIQ